jgi:MoaA/NifB/PqqE/SkfB family radical SAM enzyme
VRCLNPFRWLEVNDNGAVTPCCEPWFKGSLGSIHDQSIEEIWNGPAWRTLREAMYEGGDWPRFCDAEACPHIRNDFWIPVDFAEPGDYDILPITAEMLDDIREGRTEMSTGPAQIGLACDPRCNLRCIMCDAHDRQPRDGSVAREVLEQAHAFLPTLRRFKMMGDGEVFAIPEVREFLFSFDADAYPNLSFQIVTNGNLLTPEMWAKISHVNIDSMVVSIDAATKETYDKIRIGGNWDVLMRNMEFLVEKYREGRIREFHICMVVMKSNCHEIVAFAEMGQRFGVTSTFFSPVFGDFGEEQIFDRCDRAALSRVREELRHPIMDSPDVCIDSVREWRDWRPEALATRVRRRIGRLLRRPGAPSTPK